MNQMNTYNPIAVANYFVEKHFETGRELTPMKLVKLVYIAHGWNLAINDEPLISESVQAWKYGPVIKSVYHEFKKYGRGQITEMYAPFSWNNGIDESSRQLLDKIWDVYSKYTGIQLSTLTHQPNTPWDIVWNRQNGKACDEVIIPNDLIKEHYLNLHATRTTKSTPQES